MQAMRSRAIAFLLIAAVVAGCATAPPLKPVDWAREKVVRQSLSSWQMSGRAAVVTEKEGYNAGLRWIQQGSASEAHLQGALGVGGLRVRADGELLEVETSKGERIGPEEAGPAIERAVGVELPIIALRYWLLGVPIPNVPALEELDDHGRLVRLRQKGWDIAYDRFALVEGSWLPGRTRLEQGSVRVRVIADRWQF